MYYSLRKSLTGLHKSLDPNPTEHLCDKLEQQIQAKPHYPTSVLIRVSEWEHIPIFIALQKE